MAGTTVRISAADGGTFQCYLAVPGSGSGPGLILAEEIVGINRYMREIADLCAEEDYVVIFGLKNRIEVSALTRCMCVAMIVKNIENASNNGNFGLHV